MGNLDGFGERRGGKTLKAPPVPELHVRNVRETQVRVKHKCARRGLETPQSTDTLAGMKQQVHDHLRAWRTHCGMTQEAVAAALGVRHMTVSRWETGKIKISGQNLARLAELYSSTVPQLMAEPALASEIDLLDRLHSLAKDMAPDALAHWLWMGEQLSKK